MVLHFHSPAATPPKSSRTHPPLESVSAGVIVMSIGRLPTTVPFEDPADVAGTTVRLPYPAGHLIQYWPPQITCHNTAPEKRRFTPVPLSQSKETSQPRPIYVYRVAAWIAPSETTLLIRSNTVTAKIVTWQPVSIINSTSTSCAQPVRYQGAAEPTAPTTMASPASG